MKKLIAAAIAAVIGLGLTGCAEDAQTYRVSAVNAEQSAASEKAKENTDARGGKDSENAYGERPTLPDGSDEEKGMKEFNGASENFDGRGRGMKEFDGEMPEGFNGERPELPEDFDGEASEFSGRGGRGRGMRSFDGEMPEDFDGEMPQRPEMAGGSSDIEEFDKSGSKSEADQCGSENASQKRPDTPADSSAENGSSRKNRTAEGSAAEDGSAAGLSGTRPALPNDTEEQTGSGRQKTSDSRNAQPDASTGATQKVQ